MLLVTFYQFGKRENSTKQPTETQSDIFTTYQCLLKDDTNILHPRLILRVESLLPWNPQNWTYAYIPDFSRYYFVENWEYVKPNWECILTVDPMASHKSSIGGESKYVLRAASDIDTHMLDEAYVPTANSVMTQSRANIPFFADANYTFEHVHNGMYVIGVTGAPDAIETTGINYYIMNSTNMGNFLSYLYTNISSMDWHDNADWNAVISKAFIDPIDYIVSCYYIPLYLNGNNFPDNVVRANNKINFGFWAYNNPDLLSPFYIMKNRIIQLTLSLPTPANPYSNIYDWESLPPYSTYYINLGAGGIHKLNAYSVYNYGGVTVDMLIDIGTGMCVYNVHPMTAQNITILSTSAQLCPPVPLGRQRDNILGMLSNSAGSISSGVSAGAGAGPVGAIAGGVIGAGVAAVGTGASILSTDGLNQSGSLGSFGVTLQSYISLDRQTIQHQTFNTSEIGAPLCKTRVLGTLSGYVLCADGEIESPMYDEERKAIARYLTTGFYME